VLDLLQVNSTGLFRAAKTADLKSAVCLSALFFLSSITKLLQITLDNCTLILYNPALILTLTAYHKGELNVFL
jgi:hypothetical protein